MTNTTKQHTPGPWQVGYRDGSGPECIVQYLGDGDRPKLIAMIGFHGDPELRGDMTPEERANAELIAQAPTLLARVAELEAALGEALRTLGDAELDREAAQGTREACRAMRRDCLAALARTGGGK